MNEISERGLVHALRELSRRAGVTFDDFQRWDISFGPRVVSVRPDRGSPHEVRFPISVPQERSKTDIVRKSWMREPDRDVAEQIPDLIVPFCRKGSIAGQPLFLRESTHCLHCTEDLLTSLLLTLCRREEIDSPARDSHGRFPASASIASVHGFLVRPIVDEYGLAFQQVLQSLLPNWRPSRRGPTIKLSHDVDELGIPFSFASAVGHLLRRKAPLACAQDLWSVAAGVEPAYLRALRNLCRLSLERGLRPALYWEATARTRVDTGYDLRTPRIARLFEWAKQSGLEMGVHPSYATFRSRHALEQEVSRCRNVLGGGRLGGRQHYLRWCPQTWEDWESCGLSYDSSVGFPEHVGFRSGTCVPYLPWLWESQRCADLLEIPLVVMDGTLVEHMKFDVQQSVKLVRELLRRCSLIGGVFTLLWHNHALFPPFKRHVLPILDTLRGMQEYDWESDYERLRAESLEMSGRRLSN